jgi:hypothetical protein
MRINCVVQIMRFELPEGWLRSQHSSVDNWYQILCFDRACFDGVCLDNCGYRKTNQPVEFGSRQWRFHRFSISKMNETIAYERLHSKYYIADIA